MLYRILTQIIKKSIVLYKNTVSNSKQPQQIIDDNICSLTTIIANSKKKA